MWWGGIQRPRLIFAREAAQGKRNSRNFLVLSGCFPFSSPLALVGFFSRPVMHLAFRPGSIFRSGEDSFVLDCMVSIAPCLFVMFCGYIAKNGTASRLG